ncbi:RsmB/NOP family class I SAM-dependent RNA methyltransferase [Jannaschia sp. Os4]|uniref:RsmB/NOP family class I SAM-dependent RNA methyltransferase n=1 Tax=Jannaschia sp. Os4 TaxID=2807617 RepID=UPI001939EE25|nr:RsmB/NOP family class I SAM-dependent RNA methyltransferase [Jannaschia sp. Os4]MBM2576642.1 RsmB/NOP family class I SAM-dependent RNA methyltransferase [Jannaschia sp. Os4]
MTPGARVAAAIDILGAVLRGAPAERELTRWARGARYAGSKDRAAVRDLVFDAQRRLRSAAWLGGQGDVPVAGMDARRVVVGLLRGRGEDPSVVMDGGGHAPPPPRDDEAPMPGPMPPGVRADLPDWAWERLCADHGPRADALAQALRHRAPVHLRANRPKASGEELAARLRAEGYDAAPIADAAVEVRGAPRGLDRTGAFADGWFEPQDLGSQMLVERLPLAGVSTMLDLCAGGGGKSLALASRAPDLAITAHDRDPGRLAPLAPRAARAGAAVRSRAEIGGAERFDMVVADVPCSGSGAWRRAPGGRWNLGESDLYDYAAVQKELLERAIDLTEPGGVTAYMTCSLFEAENGAVVDEVVVGRGDVEEVERFATGPLAAEGRADGFFLAVLRRDRGSPRARGG